MVVDKENAEKLIERIEELLIVLNAIAEDLRDVSASLKSLAVSQFTPHSMTTPMPEFEMESRLDEIRMTFPDELEELLSFEEKDEFIVIKPRQFLGSENFSKIASIVRSLGGDYISAGKESHFRIPKKKT